MPLFSCGAIPHSISRESPTEKMHAHLRSFSFYPIDSDEYSYKFRAIYGKIHKLLKYQIVNYFSV